MQLRSILEVGAIEFAIKNFNVAFFNEIEDLLFRFDKETNIEEMALLDAKFHEKIIEKTKNPIIIEIYKMIYKMLVSLVVRLIAHPDVQQEAINDHKEIFKYLKSKNIEESKKRIDKHLKNIEEFIERYI